MSLEQIQAWIAEQQAQLDDTGIKNLRLTISATDCIVSGWENWRIESEAGESIAQAYAKLRSKIPLPRDLAARKREEARKLLREARELEARQ